MVAQKGSCYVRRAVADSEPDDLGGRPAEDTQAVKVLVLGDQDASMFNRQLPDPLVRRTHSDQRPHVQGAGEDVIEQAVFKFSDDQLARRDPRGAD